MVQILSKLKPSLNFSRFTDFVTSDTVIVVAGAIIVTPILLTVIGTLTAGRIPIIRDNALLGLAFASLILFILAAVFKGKIRLLFLGASAGALINAIQQTSFAQNILNRIGSAV